MQDHVAHLQRLQAQRQQLLDEKATMMSKMAEEGRSLTEEELKINAGIQAQIENVDRTITDYQVFIGQIQQEAKPIEQPVENRIQAKNYGHGVNITAQTLSKGELAGQYVAAQVLHKIKGDEYGSSNVMETMLKYNARRNPSQRFSQEVFNMFPKVNAAYASTDNGQYMGYMVDWAAKAFGEIIDLAQQQSVAMPILRSARQAVNKSTAIFKSTNGTAAWTSEGAAKAVSDFLLAERGMNQAKVATIRVATLEQILEGAPEAARILTEDMTTGIAVEIDSAFFTAKGGAVVPTPEGVFVNAAQFSPSSITAPTIDDLRGLITKALSNSQGSRLASNFIVMMHTNFAFDFWADEQFVSTQNKPVGFNFTSIDNSIMGMVGNVMPLVRSDFVTDDAGNPTIAVIDKGALVASIGALSFDFSREASIVDAGAGVTYNLFQENKIAYRMEQFVGWLNGSGVSTSPGAYMVMHTLTPSTQSVKASKSTSN